MDAYGGKNESAGKTFARAWGYALLQRAKLYSMFHIVIASQDCGDIRFLLGLGVRPDRIIACDIDPKAVEIARTFGVIISPLPRIEHTVAWAQVQRFAIGSINVDLCCSLLGGVNILGPILAAAAPLTLFTFRRGRDSTLLKRQKEQHGVKFNNDHLRALYVQEKVGELPGKQESYHSSTRTNQGSAMGIAAFFKGGKRTERLVMPEVSDSLTPVLAPDDVAYTF